MVITSALLVLTHQLDHLPALTAKLDTIVELLEPQRHITNLLLETVSVRFVKPPTLVYILEMLELINFLDISLVIALKVTIVPLIPSSLFHAL